MSLAVGVDIGGTKIAAGVVDEHGAVLARARRESPADDPAALADGIAEIVQELRADHQITAVGVAAAGFIDQWRERVMFAPNLAWRDEPLKEMVGRRVGVPTVLDNDANAAAWGEHRFGAGREARVLAMATIGTGIGGGIVADGTLARGGFGIAGEFGHMRVVPGGRRCACGLQGCWEAYASGTGLTARARELAAEAPGSAAVLLDLAGGDPAAIRGPMVSEAADRGDAAAKQAFAELARWIGEGLASIAAIVDPDAIVVGGGVSESPELDLAAVAAAFAGAQSGAGYRPKPAISLGVLGNDAGMIGAADLARSAR